MCFANGVHPGNCSFNGENDDNAMDLGYTILRHTRLKAPPSHLFPGLVLEENGVHPDRAGRIRHKDLEDMEGLPLVRVGPKN